MTKPLSFDEKVMQLAAAWEDNWQHDPANPDHISPAIEEALFSPPSDYGRDCAAFRNRLSFDIGCHAVNEYYTRGHQDRDLRGEDQLQRNDRVGLLAMMTAPLTEKDFFERAERIANVLERILGGNRLHIAEFTDNGISYGRQNRGLRTDRPLYARFNDHIASRTLNFQYDTNNNYRRPGLLHIGVVAMFQGEGIIKESRQRSKGAAKR